MPRVVQQRLGHADIRMTLSRYTHPVLADQAGAVSALEGLMEAEG